MILKIDNIEITGTVDECLDFLTKYKEKFLTILTPNYPDKSFPNYPQYPNVIWGVGDSATKIVNCENCPNKPDPNHPYIGDSPCQWCVNSPTRVTCDTKSKRGK